MEDQPHQPRKRKPRGSRKKKKKREEYPAPLKLKAVKLYLEEGYSPLLIQAETGISSTNLYRWVKKYREQGEGGLESRRNGGLKCRLPEAVRQKIIEEKKKDPTKGSKKISQFLRRMFFLGASPETVRKTLKEEGLVQKPTPKKRKRNIQKPRFFERSTPNQLWQSDIFMFRAGGKYTYLIGYIDDYSRYITGLGLFHSQTAENVIEVYRRAAAEYKPPREMLTDNGRQYTSWRGKTRFEMEMAKDKIHHFRSQPHHPMTLGKIERFWKTIYNEYLVRARFESFEDARERIQQWVKHYNHRRPHQGIGGMCPADRYFEIATELKKTIEKGIADNVLELALRGKPVEPFYMVGRMDGQSVVLQANKGKLTLSVDDKNNQQTREVTYPINNKGENNEQHQNQTHGEPENIPEESSEAIERGGGAPAHGQGEAQSSAFHLDGAQETGGDMPGAENQLPAHPQLAGPGPQGDAAGPGAPTEPGEGPGASAPAAEVPGETPERQSSQREYDRPPGEPAAENPEREGLEEPILPHIHHSERQVIHHEEQRRDGQEQGEDNPSGTNGRINSHPGGSETGPIPQDLLPVGETGSGWHVEGPGRKRGWPAGDSGGSGKGSPAEESGGPGEGSGSGQTVQDSAETLPRLGTAEGQGQE